MTLEPARVPAVSEELAAWLARTSDLEAAGKLLE
jgi:hypothetical protein